MKQYEIEFYGEGIDVMASSVTKQETEYIQKFLKIKKYDTITQAHKELKYLGIDVIVDLYNYMDYSRIKR